MSYYGRYIVFDLETGGKDPRKNAITEVAMIAIDSDSLEEVGRYETLISPYDAIYTAEAEAISGIPFELLKRDGKPIEKVFEELLDFLEVHKVGSKKPVLSGHNIDDFDMDFLKYQLFDRFKKKMSRYVSCEDFSLSMDDTKEALLNSLVELITDEKLYGKVEKAVSKVFRQSKPTYTTYNTFDTLKMSRHMITNTERHTLGLSCGARGIVIEEAHRAMPDTEANAKLLIKLLQAGRSDNSIDGTRKKKRIDFYF